VNKKRSTLRPPGLKAGVCGRVIQYFDFVFSVLRKSSSEAKEERRIPYCVLKDRVCTPPNVLIAAGIAGILLFSFTFAYSETAEYYYNWGLSCYEKGEFDEAIRQYDKAIEIDPSRPEFYNNRGLANKKKGNLGRATADFNQAITVNPGYTDAYYNRGLVYINQGNFDEAVSDYSKVIAINPRDADAYYNRGLAYDNRFKLEEAASDYEKAVEIDTEYADAYVKLGSAYQNLGRADEARENLNKALELYKNQDRQADADNVQKLLRQVINE